MTDALSSAAADFQRGVEGNWGGRYWNPDGTLKDPDLQGGPVATSSAWRFERSATQSFSPAFPIPG